jgi:hypothetical protein
LLQVLESIAEGPLQGIAPVCATVISKLDLHNVTPRRASHDKRPASSDVGSARDEHHFRDYYQP